MKKLLLLSIIFLFLTQILFAQTNFNFRYGSSYFDRAKKVIQTDDGNFIIVGQTNGFGSSGNAFMMKVNASGIILWVKDYEGVNIDIIFDVIELADRKLVMCGSTLSFGSGSYDGFVMKTDSSGNTLWAKSYGNVLYEEFYKLSADNENGFYVSGFAVNNTSSNVGIAIMKIDSAGSVNWIKWAPDWDPQGDWWPLDITSTTTGDVVVCGHGSSYGIDVWKISSSGNVLWSNRYTPTPTYSGLVGYSITENKFGDIFVNYAFSNPNTVAQSEDIGVFKLNSTGNCIWNKCYGGTYTDNCRSISKTSDGGVIICGQTNSVGNGDDDACLIKIKPDGSVSWSKAYGTSWAEHPANAIQINDSGFVFTGQTWATGSNNDSSKIHLVKTDSLGNTTCSNVSWTPSIINQTFQISIASTLENINFQSTQIPWNAVSRNFYTKNICLPVSVPSIQEIDKLWNIYPNPFSFSATIKTESVIKYATLELFNVFGQKVKQIPLTKPESQITRDNLVSGVYIYHIISDSKTVEIGKIIIQ
ncbi:MAG: T9SS type A sorting domain-containing protein [Bacteroidia bacterium]|nr:T9SS type A sorting domain-containing protein [Bacteroidia bacterium]